MVLHNLNFDPFYSRTVGFERIFDRLSRIAEENMPSQSSYPPYNIHRKGDDKFDIEIETDDAYSFIEATLITTSNQYPMEINKIPRKIKNFVFNY